MYNICLLNENQGSNNTFFLVNQIYSIISALIEEILHF